MKELPNIRLPGWTDERKIYVIAGHEPVYKRILGRWYKKASRCNMCGKCCMNLMPTWREGIDENGTCVRLVEINPGKFHCDPNKGSMPFDCLKTEHEGFDYCTVKYERI